MERRSQRYWQGKNESKPAFVRLPQIVRPNKKVDKPPFHKGDRFKLPSHEYTQQQTQGQR